MERRENSESRTDGNQMQKSVRKGDGNRLRESVRKRNGNGRNQGEGRVGRDTKLALAGKALEALGNAYAPYSRFHVAAALLCRDGEIFTGCNVENASYPAGICAERSAFAAAVSSGRREFTAIAIAGGKDGIAADFCPPCGICRQVMREFAGPDFLILLVKSGEEYREFTLEELLPESFGPGRLGRPDGAGQAPCKSKV